MAKLTTLYWRDIPAQVVASERRLKVKQLLSKRFSLAIDQAAMKADLVGTDAYLEHWHQEVKSCDKDLKAVVDAAADQLEKSYSKQRLFALVKNLGLEPESNQDV